MNCTTLLCYLYCFGFLSVVFHVTYLKLFSVFIPGMFLSLFLLMYVLCN